MTVRQLGEIWNTQHRAHPLVLCDVKATYGGWDDWQEEITVSHAEIVLAPLRACIASGGQRGHVDVFQRPDGSLVLVNAEGQGGDPVALASRTFEVINDIGVVDVPSGRLVIALAYHRLPDPDGDPRELLMIPISGTNELVVRAGDVDEGWWFDVSPRSGQIADVLAIDPAMF